MLSLLLHYIACYSAYGRFSISGLFIKIFFKYLISRAAIELFLEKKCPGLICKTAWVFPHGFIFSPSSQVLSRARHRF